LEIGDLLRKIRGRDSLRVAAKKTGLSHGFISIVEKGVDPRTKSPLKPSPETLQAYANGYHFPYDDLMVAAGYMETKESAGALPKSNVDEAVRRIEKELGISLDDDPDIVKGIENYLLTMGKMKKKSQQ
jgi:transcriptional regulator with XRE-family HTH domain